MAKELPYFQFEPAEYLTKDVSFCSLSAQGLFINICSYYWQRQCELSKDQFLKRFNYTDEFNELVKEGVIDLEGDKIIVKFLLSQYIKATQFSKEQSRKGSLGGRPKKPNESQIKPELNPNESQIKAIREDKIKEDKIIEKEIKDKPMVFSFFKSLKNLGADDNLINDWLKVRKAKRLTNTETAFKLFEREFLKTQKDVNFVLTKCIEKSWGGFEAGWLTKDTPQSNTRQGNYFIKPDGSKIDLSVL
jgi:hypothetical protein